MSYNGWSNYETWAVVTWLENDKGSYEAAREAVKGLNEHGAGDAIQELVYDAMPDLGASLYGDLLKAALGEVDWQEVAAAFCDGEINQKISVRP